MRTVDLALVRGPFAPENRPVCHTCADGFVDRDAFEGAEVPKELRNDWRFMELSLR